MSDKVKSEKAGDIQQEPQQTTDGEVTLEGYFTGGPVLETKEEEKAVLILMMPEDDVNIASIKEASAKILDIAEKRIVKDPETATAATDDLAIISGYLKTVDARRKDMLQPFRDYIDGVNALCKEIAEPLNKADAITRKKLLAYKQELEERQRKQEEINRKRLEAAQAEAELKNGEISESVNLVEVTEAPTTIHANIGDVSGRKAWHYEVVDFALLPDEYKLPNDRMIKAAISSSKGQKQIPGIKIWQEESLTVTARKE